MNEVLSLLSRLRPDVELGLGLVIALAVTMHVLLTDREVKTATAWIGLAWFSPFLGGVAYVLLGINRVQRRALRLRGGSRDPEGRSRQMPVPSDQASNLDLLSHGVAVITGRPSEPGNLIEMLRNGDEAYPAMLEAIEGARDSIGLCSYIMRDDVIGQRFVAALQQAKDRGVQVRVIVDGIGGGWLTSPAFWHLRRAGVTSERFMHSALPWRMPFFNLRTHRKILVVDGRIGFTGGINIADQNILANDPANPVQDTHFRLEGPVVGQLVEAFAVDWAFVSGESLDGPAWFPKLAPVGGAMARVVTAGPDQDLEKIELVVLEAIACARRSICVMTPYFLPDERVMTALSIAAMRGVAVDIILPERGDHRFVEWASAANIKPFIRDGGRIWQSAPPFHHSKAMVVDGEWSLVGSSNWDMRSFRLNFELCVELRDLAFARQLEDLMVKGRGRLLTVERLDARGLLLRLRDSVARLLLPYL
jgi:cardiolipin synthase